MNLPEPYGERLRILEGGYSGETYLSGGGADRVVVRIYARDPSRAAIDASLLTLMRGLLPVPQVLELRHPTEESPGVLVTEYVDGTPLDVLLSQPQAGGVDLETLSRSLASLITTLSGVPFLRFGGFVDGELAVVGWDGGDGLREWGQQHRDFGRLGGWAARDHQALDNLLVEAQERVDEAGRRRAARPVLTHSDLNPKNLLVNPATAEVTAVLDWEFAHAGSEHADLGNLCRFERDQRLVQPLLAEVSAARGLDPGEQRLLARASDLWALVDLAARPVPNAVSVIAETLLLAQARTGDLDAWPWSSTRIAPGARRAEGSAKG